MKRSGILFLIALLSVISIFAQKDKDVIKLTSLHQKKSYQKIKDYKNGNLQQLSAQALYLKGLACYFTSDDKLSLKYLTLAIDKGPADFDMFYYRGMTHYYMRNATNALSDVKNAVALNPLEPAFYSALGDVYSSLTLYDSALIAYNNASKLTQNDPELNAKIANSYLELKQYDLAINTLKNGLTLATADAEIKREMSYNLALAYQMSHNYNAAELHLWQHLSDYPKDNEAISKLIQALSAQSNFTKTDSLKNLLILAHVKGELPDHMQTMFCIDQFEWKEYKTFVFESYQVNMTEVFPWMHKFLLQKNDEDISIRIYGILDSLKSTEEDWFQLALIRNDSLSIYGQFTYKADFDYPSLKKAAIAILDGQVLADTVIADYEKWQQIQSERKASSNGSNFKNAIIVNSISEEYQWLRDHFPGYQFIMQSLVHEGGKSYDVLKIKTTSGDIKSFYFDISSFFGKGWGIK